MAAAIAADAAVIAGPRFATERLRLFLLWCTGLAGAFVFVEPSPYEIVALATIFLFAVTGLALRASLAPLVILLILLSLGFGMSVVQVGDQSQAVTWVAVSVFLAMTAVFYAGMLGANTEMRLKRLMQGYMAAAVVASLMAIAAYFRLFGESSALFLLYDRARGTFNDPNVLGAFLILPALLVFERVLVGRPGAVLRNGVILLVLMTALLLTFSRGAWGQFALCVMLLMLIRFVTSRSPNERMRIVLIAIAGLMILLAFIAALLSIEQVAELFRQRAAFEQSYDIRPLGRFDRYSLGLQLAVERPFGIGPLQFSRYFTEDPHNTFLNAFMSGGWLAGFVYPTLTLITIAMGFRFLKIASPWRSIYQAVYVAFVGTTVESVIIDIDHWRHYFLILGVLWGLMAMSRQSLLAATRDRDVSAHQVHGAVVPALARAGPPA
jgi:hypothetical protein